MTVTLADLRCSDCGDATIISIWPGGEGLQGELFQLTPWRIIRCWCEACWVKKFGAKPRLPTRQKGRVAAEQR